MESQEPAAVTGWTLDCEITMIDAGFGHRNPMVVAAAAVYTACLMSGENKTQSDVAEAVGVNVKSLRKCAGIIRRLVNARSIRTNDVKTASQNV